MNTLPTNLSQLASDYPAVSRLLTDGPTTQASTFPAGEVESVAVWITIQLKPDAALELVLVLLIAPTDALWDALAPSLPRVWIRQLARWIATQKDSVAAFLLVLLVLAAIVKDIRRDAVAQQQSYLA
jgi:hypothetical protein